MGDRIRLAVLGGSGVATPELVRVLASAPDRPPMTVCLIGRTAEKLERVARVSARLAQPASPPLEVTHATDARAGLEGADFVLNQIRVGGYRARAYDETFPHEFGIPGEETFGPGGMNNALRTVPATLDYCRDIEAVAPDALLVNLTNPSSYIQYAVSRYSRVRVLGVCDSPVTMADALARLLGARVEDLWVGYVGMHHFGWIVEARLAGRDVMPDAMARIGDLTGLPVDADIVRAIGAIPSPYFRYYYHPDRMLAKQRGKPSRAEELIELERAILGAYDDPASGEALANLARRGAHWYEEIVVPVLLAVMNDSRRIFTLNVTNAGALPWMPPDAVVELPVVAARHGFYPLSPPAVPPELQAMLRTNAAFEMLWVEAVVERSYDKALRAMVLNHLVRDLDKARAILEKIWNR